MTIEEVFCSLSDKYGDDFNWHLIPLSQSEGTFVDELKKEIGQNHFLYGKRIFAVAKCEANDDVLYVTESELKTSVYYIFHLTYSAHNADGFPKYKKFENIYAVTDYIETEFIKDYM